MEIVKQAEYTFISRSGLKYFNVVPGVWGMKILFVNIYMVSSKEGWVLIDAGLRGYGDKIRRMAEDIFGEGIKPSAILLTHGHFDHVGSLEELMAIWNVPVYAHYLELPYLKGTSRYPPADPMVGGGLMSLISGMFPRQPKDLGRKIHSLPVDGSVPGMPGWEYIHTPGHSPGQVSFFRERDRTLISADAFVTTKQESAFSVMTQNHILSGPPKYFTIDWIEAEKSVRKLYQLKPAAAATGHGYPMYGQQLQTALSNLVENFESQAVPAYGRYVKEPARTNKNGVQYVPKRVFNPTIITNAAVLGLIGTAAIVWQFTRKKKRRSTLQVF